MTPKARTVADPARCPLCGEPNACALAGERVDRESPCWCVGKAFPDSLRERAADADGGAACICRGCLARAQAEPG